jgi:acid stress-induced BolA-like protein IbaG/YrbA
MNNYSNVRAFNMLKTVSHIGSTFLALNAVRNKEPGSSDAFLHAMTDLTTLAVEITRRRFKQRVVVSTPELGAEEQEGLDSVIKQLNNFFTYTTNCTPSISKMQAGVFYEYNVDFGQVNGEQVGFSFGALSETYRSLQNAKSNQEIYKAIRTIMKNNGIDSTFSDGTLTLKVYGKSLCQNSSI